MVGREYVVDTTDNYRYGFNGKEGDNEGLGGGQSTYDYGFRIYNPSLGRFLSTDPIGFEFPWSSTYAFAENDVMRSIDLEGAEKYLVVEYQLKNSLGKTFIYKTDYRYVQNGTENSAARNARFNNNPGTIAVILRIRYNASNIETGKQIITGQSNTLRSNSLLQSQFTNINANSTYMFGLDRGMQGSINPNKIFTATHFKAPTVFFENDKGLINEDFYKAFEKSPELRNNIDNMVKILIENPNYKLQVTGYASTKPTNINGTKTTTTSENNNELAGMRAESAKMFLIQYAKDHYCVDINPGRISTANGGTIPTANEGKARKVVFENK